MHFSPHSFIIVLLIIPTILFTSPSSSQSIVAIDAGVTYFKVVLVAVGKGFDIALSPDSKRKSYTAVSMLDEVRGYGSEAFNVYGKKPQAAVWRIRDMLGRPHQHTLFTEILPQHLLTHHAITKDDTTRGVRLQFGKGLNKIDERVVSPEELMAMLFVHAKEMGEKHGNTKVSQLALTVPSFYDQFQRQGLLDAAEIAGLTLLSLVDENGAGAVQYASDRVFDTNQTLLIFNMGAGSTQVSVVQFAGSKRLGKDVRHVRVLSKAWDETLGSETIDLALANFFAQEFEKAHPKLDPITQSPRAMVRLKKEARAVKEILSGLEKFPVNFQALHQDRDFKYTMTRQIMESIIKDTVLGRIHAPIERALTLAEITPQNLTFVEIVGGGIRVPAVRTEIQKSLAALGGKEKEELSTHLNGDEGMVFGAAFVGANVSKTFHVPRMVLYEDVTPREVRFMLRGVGNSYSSESKGSLDDDNFLFQDRVLWPRFSPIEAKEDTVKQVKFKWANDFDIELVQVAAPDDVDKTNVTIAAYRISGVSSALESFGKFGEPKIHVVFAMDRNLMARVASVEARFEEEYEEVIKPPVPPKNKTANATSENVTTTPDEAATEETTTPPPPKTVKKIRKHSFPLRLDVRTESLLVSPMPLSMKRDMQAILQKWDEQDRNRARTAAALNSLEAFSFTARDRLRNHEKEVLSVTTQEALDALMKELADVEEWIPDNARTGGAGVTECDELRATLTNKVDHIFDLISEHKNRPDAVKALTMLLDAVEERSRTNWTVERPWVLNSTRYQAIMNFTRDTRVWLQDKLGEQNKLTMRDEPVLTVSMIRHEVENCQRLIENVLKLRKPYEPPPTTLVKDTKTDDEGGRESRKDSSSGGAGADDDGTDQGTKSDGDDVNQKEEEQQQTDEQEPKVREDL